MNDRTGDKEVQEIPRADLFTPAEHKYIMSTPEEGEWLVNVPIGVSKGLPIEQVREQRRERLSQVRSYATGRVLDFGRDVVIRFSDELDPETGEVIGEPRFIGLWDRENRRVEMAENPEEFDREVKARLAELMNGFERKSD